MRQTIREWLRRMLAVFLSLVMIGGGFPTTALAGSVSPLTVTGLSVDDKEYDGTTDATITQPIEPALDGIAPDDIGKVSVDMSKVHAYFADADAADDKTVHFEADDGALTGEAAYKYQLVIPNVAGNIKPVEVFAINFDAESKEYNGDTDAVVKSDNAEIYKVSNRERIISDLKAVATDPHFEDATVGEHNVWYGIELRVGEETTATPNYKVNETQSQMKTTASITPRVVALAWDTTPLVYNDQEQAPTATVTNAVGSEEVTVTVTGAKKNAGEDYDAYASELAGANAGNYTLSGTENREKKFSIGKASLQDATITGVEESYGYTGVQIKPEPTVTMSDGDHEWTLEADTDYTVEYGTNIKVGPGDLMVKATDNGNYTDNQLKNFQIVKVAPEATDPVAAENLVYKAEDQNLLSEEGQTSDGTVQYAFGEDEQTAPGGDNWSPAMPQKKDAGDYYVWWKVVGDDNHNDKDPACVGKVTIAKATVTVSGVKAQNKTYDGKTDASLDGNASLNGVEEADKKDVSLSNGTAEFEDKNVGENKTVTFKDFKLEGDRASNYELTQPADVTATISPLEATIAWGSTALTYTGEEQAPEASVSNKVSDDTVKVTVEGAQKEIGTGYTAEVTGLTGTDAANYKLPTEGLTTSFTIMTEAGDDKPTVEGVEESYEYTGEQIKPEVTVKQGTTTLVENIDYTVEYGENKEIGKGNGTVTVRFAGNFSDFDPQEKNFDITKIEPTTTDPEAATDLVYNAKDQNLLSKEGSTSDGTVQYAFGEDDQTAPGEGWSPAVPQKKDAGDYYVWWRVDPKDEIHAGTDPACVGKVTIAPKPVTPKYVIAYPKTYDGNTKAEASAGELDGVEEVDKQKVTLKAGTGEFEDKNAGDSKKVTFKDFDLTGDAVVLKNYKLAEQPADDTASIYPASVILGGITAEDKAYDGTTTATLNEESLANATISGMLNGDELTVATTSYEADFEDANVGKDKKVNFKVALDGKDKGNYKINDKNSQTSTTATITPGAASVKVTPAELTYNGKAQTLATAEVKPEGAKVLWYVGDEEPTTETKWSEDVPSETNAGVYTVWYVVPEEGNFKGTEPESQTITIAPREAALSWSNTSFTYDGKRHRPTATVSNLVAGDACTVTVTGDQTNAGSYTATATELSNANYKMPSTTTTQYTIRKSIKDSTITVTKPSGVIYDGKEHKNKPVIKDTVTNATLVENTDYTLSWSSDVTNAGTVTVTVTGKGNYKDAQATTFTILAARLTSATGAAKTYNGKAQTTTWTVKAGSLTVPASDYSVSDYKSNTNVGTATATITGKGNYAGTLTGEFKINPASIAKAKVTLAKTSYVCNGKARKPAVTSMVLGGKTLKAGTDYAVSYKDNVNPGTATVTVTGKGNYKGTAKATFAIKLAKAAKPATVIRLAKGSVEASWKAVAGAKSYELQWRKAGGKWQTATVTATTKTVKGLAKNARYEFRVRAVAGSVKGAWSDASRRWTKSVTSPKAAPGKAKGSVKASWKANAAATGGFKVFVYSKKGGKAVKTKVVKAGATSATVKGLESGKTYYVRVRPYLDKSGTTYVGVYSGYREAQAK